MGVFFAITCLITESSVCWVTSELSVALVTVLAPQVKLGRQAKEC